MDHQRFTQQCHYGEDRRSRVLFRAVDIKVFEATPSPLSGHIAPRRASFRLSDLGNTSHGGEKQQQPERQWTKRIEVKSQFQVAQCIFSTCPSKSSSSLSSAFPASYNTDDDDGDIADDHAYPDRASISAEQLHDVLVLEQDWGQPVLNLFVGDYPNCIDVATTASGATNNNNLLSGATLTPLEWHLQHQQHITLTFSPAEQEEDHNRQQATTVGYVLHVDCYSPRDKLWLLNTLRRLLDNSAAKRRSSDLQRVAMNILHQYELETKAAHIDEHANGGDVMRRQQQDSTPSMVKRCPATAAVIHGTSAVTSTGGISEANDDAAATSINPVYRTFFKAASLKDDCQRVVPQRLTTRLMTRIEPSQLVSSSSFRLSRHFKAQYPHDEVTHKLQQQRDDHPASLDELSSDSDMLELSDDDTAELNLDDQSLEHVYQRLRTDGRIEDNGEHRNGVELVVAAIEKKVQEDARNFFDEDFHRRTSAINNQRTRAHHVGNPITVPHAKTSTTAGVVPPPPAAVGFDHVLEALESIKVSLATRWRTADDNAHRVVDPFEVVERTGLPSMRVPSVPLRRSQNAADRHGTDVRRRELDTTTVAAWAAVASPMPTLASVAEAIVVNNNKQRDLPSSTQNREVSKNDTFATNLQHQKRQQHDEQLKNTFDVAETLSPLCAEELAAQFLQALREDRSRVSSSSRVSEPQHVTTSGSLTCRWCRRANTTLDHERQCSLKPLPCPQCGLIFEASILHTHLMQNAACRVGSVLSQYENNRANGNYYHHDPNLLAVSSTPLGGGGSSSHGMSGGGRSSLVSSTSSTTQHVIARAETVLHKLLRREGGEEVLHVKGQQHEQQEDNDLWNAVRQRTDESLYSQPPDYYHHQRRGASFKSSGRSSSAAQSDSNGTSSSILYFPRESRQEDYLPRQQSQNRQMKPRSNVEGTGTQWRRRDSANDEDEDDENDVVFQLSRVNTNRPASTPELLPPNDHHYHQQRQQQQQQRQLHLNSIRASDDDTTSQILEQTTIVDPFVTYNHFSSQRDDAPTSQEQQKESHSRPDDGGGSPMPPPPVSAALITPLDATTHVDAVSGATAPTFSPDSLDEQVIRSNPQQQRQPNNAIDSGNSLAQRFTNFVRGAMTLETRPPISPQFHNNNVASILPTIVSESSRSSSEGEIVDREAQQAVAHRPPAAAAVQRFDVVRGERYDRIQLKHQPTNRRDFAVGTSAPSPRQRPPLKTMSAVSEDNAFLPKQQVRRSSVKNFQPSPQPTRQTAPHEMPAVVARGAEERTSTTMSSSSIGEASSSDRMSSGDTRGRAGYRNPQRGQASRQQRLSETGADLRHPLNPAVNGRPPPRNDAHRHHRSNSMQHDDDGARVPFQQRRDSSKPRIRSRSVESIHSVDSGPVMRRRRSNSNRSNAVAKDYFHQHEQRQQSQRLGRGGSMARLSPSRKQLVGSVPPLKRSSHAHTLSRRSSPHQQQADSCRWCASTDVHHVEDTCSMRKMRCRKCEQFTLFRDKDHHRAVCPATSADFRQNDHS
ncbi:Hypothetical protein, putative [Bodo saltans]|uniref:Uncharacterized protein n=1 Tax=Bodo saltans TaxID=75058 RepID=A0A0S4KK86_BODSA|nr:Hypothetical protein, putative [Bodo saltans]|eukprot:CUI13274.1 Hypothetical protein, putative [Bodo saltans]